MGQFLIQNQWVVLAVVLWTIPWKGVALWKAAKNNHKQWFVALLVINTLGILEMLYIFVFSKREISKKNIVKNSEAELHQQKKK